MVRAVFVQSWVQMPTEPGVDKKEEWLANPLAIMGSGMLLLLAVSRGLGKKPAEQWWAV